MVTLEELKRLSSIAENDKRLADTSFAYEVAIKLDEDLRTAAKSGVRKFSSNPMTLDRAKVLADITQHLKPEVAIVELCRYFEVPTHIVVYKW